MPVRDALADRLGDPGSLAVVLLGGVVAVYGLFVVGAAVWNGRLPPGTFPLALLVIFLAVVVAVPTPDPDPEPEPHEVWQRELEGDGEPWDDEDDPRDDSDDVDTPWGRR